MATTEERVSVVEETQRILAEVNSRQQRFIEQNALRIDAHEERMEELRRYTIQAHRDLGVASEDARMARRRARDGLDSEEASSRRPTVAPAPRRGDGMADARRDCKDRRRRRIIPRPLPPPALASLAELGIPGRVYNRPGLRHGGTHE